tara:strand:- start:6880 stop:9714 length:2835 start_codon:yes stop_codon:yes gene_type:complete
MLAKPQLYALASCWFAFAPITVSGTEGIAFFEEHVRPILMERCLDCHSEESGKRKGGLWLDRKEAWQMGGDGGPAIVPGDLEESLLVHTIRYLEPSLQMPPKSKLPDEEIAILEQWIAMGAPDPRNEALAGAVRKTEIDYEAARRSWAFRPHVSPEIPTVNDAEWARNAIDPFILAPLEAHGLEPAADAAPRALIRRLYFDLTGLPPTPEEVEAFARNPSQEASEALIDDLLARPAFGEKWGRHWLDIARYSDSNGADRNFTFPQAWRYRNYVIDSFNRDRPFYEFVQQQLAGDLLPAGNDEQRREQLVAATFLALGPKMLTERDKEKLRLDTADEQLDTVGRAFLGLTMGCARCHDHKFDPISQRDYYAMAGIFRSTQVVMGTRNGCVNVASWVERPLPIPEPERSQLAAKVERLELAMRLTVEKSFMKKAGGKMTLDNLPLAGVIYDEADAELVGNWKASTISMNRFGKGYIHDDQEAKGEKKAIFTAALPENGEYEVRLAYSSASNRASNVPIKVEAWKNIHHVALDETKRPSIGGLFEPIGRFRFEKGGRAKVTIETGETNGYVIVDAVQFIAVDDIEREAMALAAVEGEQGEDELFRMTEGELKKVLGKLIGELRGAELAMAPRDAKDAGDINLRVRGEVGQLGPVVPRNFPLALHAGDQPKISDGESGRRQLATWITGPENALLDRVIANRLWHNLMGRGIVASVDNFGALGTKPTHPELLDHLATQFRNSGGSMKTLIREIASSRTYQLSTTVPASQQAADPKNDLFGRQNHRRLTAEEIRDSALFLAGELESSPGQATASKFGVDLDKPISFAKEKLRTVYLPIARNNLVADLEVFDAANPDLVSGNRAETTVPTQALYLINSDFFLSKAKILGTKASSKPDRISWLYETILNRPPETEEASRAQAFVSEISPNPEEAHAHLAHLLLVSTEFLYLD